MPESKYARAIAEYDPQKDGTIKSYCERLGLDYQGYRKAAYEKRKKQGIKLREMSDYSAYYQELVESGEPIKEFCKRHDLDYSNFRISWYRYRKTHNIEIRKREKKSEESESPNPPEQKNES